MIKKLRIHSLTSIVILSVLLPAFTFISLADAIQTSTETQPREAIASDSNHKIELAQYFLRSEIDFLARQSMKLGGYEYVAKHKVFDATNSTNSDEEEKLEKLEFTAASLQRELNYVRSLRELHMQNRSDLKSIHGTDILRSPNISHSAINIFPTNLLKNLRRFISGATVSSIANSYYFMGKNDLYGNDFDLQDMYNHLDCQEHASKTNKPLYTPEIRKNLWTTFEAHTLFPSFPIPTIGELRNPLLHVGHTEDEKGRGVFASQDIKKGTMVLTAHPGSVFFLNAADLYRFINSLPSREMACDVIEWVWMQDIVPDSGNRVVCLNMDDGAFVNHGGKEFSNIRLKDSTSLEFFAKSDISKGEEILYDYDSTVWSLAEMNLDV